MIKQVSIITQAGAKTYEVGQKLTGGIISKIVLGHLYFTGDPFAQYIGYDENGKMLFSCDPLCPHECEYL